MPTRSELKKIHQNLVDAGFFRAITDAQAEANRAHTELAALKTAHAANIQSLDEANAIIVALTSEILAITTERDILLSKLEGMGELDTPSLELDYLTEET